MLTLFELTVEPGRYDDPLRGSLEVVSINSTGSYEALSYVWTDPELPDTRHEILVHDENGKVGLLGFDGGSIFAALRSIRRSTLPRRLWADQCCINQSDQVERSEQVKFMNMIYRDATQILVWLYDGPGGSYKQQVTNLHRIRKYRKKYGSARQLDTL